MKVVLFCGGQGMRLREYSETVPKPMVPVGNRPILWHLMKYYALHGHTDFILCLGHGAGAIKQFFLDYEEAESNDFVLRSGQKIMLGSDLDDWTISFVDTGLRTEPGERLYKVRSFLEGENAFLVNYADGVTDLDHNKYEREFEASGKVGAMTLVNPPQTYDVVEVVDSKPRAIRPMGKAGLWVNGGFFIFDQRVFDYLERDMDLSSAIGLMIDDDQIYANQYEGFWMSMDTFKEKQQLDQIFEAGDVPWLSNGS